MRSLSSIKWRHLHTHALLHWLQLPAVELIFLQTPHFQPFVPWVPLPRFSSNQSCWARATAKEMREFHARVHSSARPLFSICLSDLLPADLVCWSCGRTAAAAAASGHMDAAAPYANSAIGCKHGVFPSGGLLLGLDLHIQTLLPGVCSCFPVVTRVLFME